MRGTRIPVQSNKDPLNALIEAGRIAGSYYGPVMGYSSDRPAVFFFLPIASDKDVPNPSARSLHHVVSPPHTFTENPDGTLTIMNSIAAGGTGPEQYWHGYLKNGIWEKC